MPKTLRKLGETPATVVRVGCEAPETDATLSLYLAIAWKLRLWSRRASKFGSAMRDGRPFEVTSKTAMIRFGLGYGSGRNNTLYTTLKIAVVPPMPSASVRMATAVKPGFLRSCRIA